MFEKEPTIENDLENFHEEIQALKEEEVVDKVVSIHLADLDPYNLTQDDMVMYKRYKEAKESEMEEVRVEFEEYRNEIMGSFDNEDRKIFVGYLGNVLATKIEKDLVEGNRK